MLNPKLSAIRSIASKSSFRGNNAAINEYPGRKSTKGRPKMILIGEISFRGGIRTKGMHKSVKNITSARSFWKCLSFGRIYDLFMFYVVLISFYKNVSLSPSSRGHKSESRSTHGFHDIQNSALLSIPSQFSTNHSCTFFNPSSNSICGS